MSSTLLACARAQNQNQFDLKYFRYVGTERANYEPGFRTGLSRPLLAGYFKLEMASGPQACGPGRGLKFQARGPKRA